MDADFIPNGDRAMLVAAHGAATSWLKRQPETSTLQRHDLGGRFAVSGRFSVIRMLCIRMTEDGFNVQYVPMAA